MKILMEDERSGYWNTLIKGGPRNIIARFYDKDEKLIHEQEHERVKRFKILPLRLQHRWPDVHRRVTVDKETGEVLDRRTRKGQSEAAMSAEEYDQLEVDAYQVNRYPGVQESGLEPKSILKIEYFDPVTKELIHKLIDVKTIAHNCSKDA